MNIPYNIGDFIRSKRYRENGWNNTKNYAIQFCENILEVFVKNIIYQI